MNLYLAWLVALLLFSLLSGIIRYVLGIKVTSRFKYGGLVYEAVDSGLSGVLFYLFLSALAGHYLL